MLNAVPKCVWMWIKLSSSWFDWCEGFRPLKGRIQWPQITSILHQNLVEKRAVVLFYNVIFSSMSLCYSTVLEMYFRHFAILWSSILKKIQSYLRSMLRPRNRAFYSIKTKNGENHCPWLYLTESFQKWIKTEFVFLTKLLSHPL